MKKFVPLLIAIMLCATICLSACANTDFFVVANGDVNNFDTSLFYGNTKTMQSHVPSGICGSVPVCGTSGLFHWDDL